MVYLGSYASTMVIILLEGPVTLGHCVVPRLIPWGSYTAGAQNFRALVYIWSKRSPSFVAIGAILFEIFVFFWWEVPFLMNKFFKDFVIYSAACRAVLTGSSIKLLCMLTMDHKISEKLIPQKWDSSSEKDKYLKKYGTDGNETRWTLRSYVYQGLEVLGSSCIRFPWNKTTYNNFVAKGDQMQQILWMQKGKI